MADFQADFRVESTCILCPNLCNFLLQTEFHSFLLTTAQIFLRVDSKIILMFLKYCLWTPAV